MPLTKQGNFTFNHVDQQDDLYKVKSALEIKTDFDSQAVELKNTLNALIDSLKSQVANDSGAENIGIEPINGVTGANVQSALEDLRVKINSAVAGAIPDGTITKVKLDPAMYAQLIDYAIATGASNTYIVTLNPAPTTYTDGMALSVRINVDSTGASTLNVNSLGAKSLKKANGNDLTNLKTNGVYTFRYNSATGNFILQGEGGSGTATAPDVLAGKTASTDTGDVTGTMTNRGAMTITPGTTNQTIPAGYHNGSGVVNGDTNLIASNILSGKTIFGVAGSLVKGLTEASATLSGLNLTDGQTLAVTGLSFTPKYIVLVATVTGSTIYGFGYQDGATWISQKNGSSANAAIPISPVSGGFTIQASFWNTGQTITAVTYHAVG